MQQAVDTGHNFDEGAEIDDLAHLAVVDAADFGLRRDRLDCGYRLFHRDAVGRGDQHRTVVLDIYIAAGLLDESTDYLAAGADNVANLVGLDMKRDDSRRIGRDFLARRIDSLLHHAEHEQPRVARLMQRLAHHVARHAADLVVHLDRGDAVGRARDLEVHVAEMVLVAEDVGEDTYLIALLDETHRDSSDRRLDRHPRVHQGETPAAHRRHRGAAVGFENLGDDANRVREVGLVGQHRRERALGERAMANFAARRSTQEFDFAGGERRKIVVEHELLVAFAQQRVDFLLVGRGPERHGNERLGFAAREYRGTMRARQHLDLRAQRANLGRLAIVDTAILFENRAADAVGECVKRGAALLLAADLERLFEFARDSLLDGGDYFGRDYFGREFALGLARKLLQLVLQLEDRAHLLMCGEERLEDRLFVDDVGAAFEHHDRIGRGGDHQRDVAVLEIADKGIDDELAIDPAHAHGGNGAVVRYVGDFQRGRRRDQREHIRIVVAVRGKHRNDDLRFLVVALGEQRTHRAVDKARRENFLLRRTSLALEETAGNLAGGEGPFLVVDGEREKVHLLAALVGRHDRGEHNRIPILREHRAMRLLRQPPRLQRQRPAGKLDL